MIKTLNNTIKQDRTAYKIPRSVQDVIPIQRIFADGIFQFGTKYSRTLRFSDINYAIASKEDKTAMFLGYSELLNALDSGSTTKLTICNKQVNRQAFEDTVLLPQRGDNLDGFVDEFNGMLEGKISGSSASVEQERFITVSVHKKTVDEARTFFSRVTGEVSSKLSRLNSSSNELDAAERLDVLRGFFRPDESSLPFDLQTAMKRGHNLKDTICPDSLEFHRDYFKMGSQYGRVLFLKDYASYIKDSMILELTDLNRRMMLSIDMIPVPTDEAVREATIHLLGDRYGYISAPLLGNFAEQMIGYDKITGLNEASKGTASARLTISAEVQKAALQALGSYHGAVGVYNYKTGEILCAVTSPSYDPDNIPDIAGDETGAYDGVYLNRFFDAAYTPGSIFKLVTSAAALEKSASAQAGTHTCAGKTIIGGQEIVCMSSHGTLAMPEALAHSCNVYYGELASALGKDTLQAVCDKLGLNGMLTCDGYTARSTVDLSDADDGSVAWAGIGQYTDQITAIQFLRFMGVIANGGEAAEPYLMQKISRAGQTVYEAETKTTGRLLSEETAEALGKMMRGAVVNQYGAWQFGSLTVCAKSGTAERENGPADAMFAGFVEDEAYPLAFVVFAERGGSGSQTAAPIAAKVLAACKTMLDAPNPNG